MKKSDTPRTDALGNTILKASCQPCAFNHDEDTCPVCNAASLFENLCKDLEHELLAVTAASDDQKTILHEPLLHSLGDCIRELKYGRPADAQKFLDDAAATADRLHLSDQQVWYRRRKTKGLCCRCGKDRLGSTTLYCPTCKDKLTAYNQKRHKEVK